eukprot:1445390-Pleurochrysis_carterae.AAC.2
MRGAAKQIRQRARAPKSTGPGVLAFCARVVFPALFCSRCCALAYARHARDALSPVRSHHGLTHAQRVQPAPLEVDLRVSTQSQ